MLHAFLSGKKRGTGAEGESLSATFSGAEDTLTASVFERLMYFPDQVVCNILFDAQVWQTSFEGPRQIISARFWPRWKNLIKDGKKEPDLVIEFDDRVLVIEAKRYDFNDQQRPDQLGLEWLAGIGAYGASSRKSLWLLGVGGLPDSRAETVDRKRECIRDYVKREYAKREYVKAALYEAKADEVRFSAIPWFKLVQIIERQLGCAPASHTARLLEDIRAAMLVHGVGVAPPQWLADLIEESWLRARPTHHSALQTLAKKADPYFREFRPITSMPNRFAGV